MRHLVEAVLVRTRRWSRVTGTDLLQGRPVGDHRGLGRGAPPPVDVDEGVRDHHHRGRAAGAPALAATSMSAATSAKTRESLLPAKDRIATACTSWCHSTHGMPRSRRHEREDDQGRDRHVGGHHHVRAEPPDLARPARRRGAAPAAAACRSASWRSPRRRRSGRRRGVSPGSAVRCALAGGVGGAVGVRHLVAAPGELAAQLDLERVTAVVVEQDPHAGAFAQPSDRLTSS